MHKQNLDKNTKNLQQQTFVFYNLKSPKVIWKPTTWNYMPNMKYFKLISHLN
jgi:hypothetical protein